MPPEAKHLQRIYNTHNTAQQHDPCNLSPRELVTISCPAAAVAAAGAELELVGGPPRDCH